MMARTNPASVANEGVPVSQGVPQNDPRELAAPISARVQIQGVLLIESHCKRGADADFSDGDLQLAINVPQMEHNLDKEENRLRVQPTFVLKGTRGSENEASPILSIQATFVLEYSVESVEGLEDRNFEAFSWINGTFNAWPYWREYVQNTVARMGLPPITVPVFRV